MTEGHPVGVLAGTVENTSTHGACVCAFDKGCECDSEKTGDRETKSRGMDCSTVLNLYMFILILCLQEDSWLGFFF